MSGLIPFNTLWGKDNFLARYFAVREAVFTEYMHCETHGRLCPTNQGSKLDIAGLPCQGNSSVGRGWATLIVPEGGRGRFLSAKRLLKAL